MPIINLATTLAEDRSELPRNEEGQCIGAQVFRLPDAAIKHCSYIKGLIEAAPDSDAVVEVPHASPQTLAFMCAFLEQHKDDEEVDESWGKQKPRELTEWDKVNFKPHERLYLVDLLKSSNFLGCQMMLNAVATYIGQILVTLNEEQVQEYFGIWREFTKEEEDQVKAKYPLPFF